MMKHSFLHDPLFWLPHDKRGHFIGGLLLALAVLPFVGPLWATAVAALAGLLKEVYDMLRIGGSGFSVPDLFATSFGGAVPYVSIVLSAN